MIIKEATGIDLIVAMYGHKIISTYLNLPAKKASTIPATRAIKKPNTILENVNQTELKNSDSVQIVQNLRATSTGDANKTF